MFIYTSSESLRAFHPILQAFVSCLQFPCRHVIPVWCECHMTTKVGCRPGGKVCLPLSLFSDGFSLAIQTYSQIRCQQTLVVYHGWSCENKVLDDTTINLHDCYFFFSKFYIRYHICPYRSAVPNRRASPSINKHTTSNSHQMPDKTSKHHQETLKFKRYSSLFGSHTCANHDFLANKGPHGSRLPYICTYVRIVGTGRKGLLLKLNRCAPKPFY